MTLKGRAADAGVVGFRCAPACGTPPWCAGGRAGGTETGLRAHAGWTSNVMINRYVKAASEQIAGEEFRPAQLGHRTVTNPSCELSLAAHWQRALVEAHCGCCHHSAGTDRAGEGCDEHPSQGRWLAGSCTCMPAPQRPEEGELARHVRRARRRLDHRRNHAPVTIRV